MIWFEFIHCSFMNKQDNFLAIRAPARVSKVLVVIVFVPIHWPNLPQNNFQFVSFVDRFSVISSHRFFVNIYSSVVNFRIFRAPFFSGRNYSTINTHHQPQQDQLESSSNQQNSNTDKVISLTNRIISISLDVDHSPRYHFINTKHFCCHQLNNQTTCVHDNY